MFTLAAFVALPMLSPILGLMSLAARPTEKVRSTPEAKAAMPDARSTVGLGEPAATAFTGKFANLSAKEKDLLNEYRANFARLKRCHDNIAIEARERVWAIPPLARDVSGSSSAAEVVLTEERHFAFHANGGNHYRMDGREYDPRDLSKPIRLGVAIITADEAYLFGQRPSDGEYFVMGRAKSRKGIDELARYSFHIAPFAEGALSLDAMLLRDGGANTIAKVELLDDANEQLVAVTSVHASKGNANRTLLRFYRKRAWAVKDIRHEEITERDRKQLRIVVHRCLYSGEHEGVPLLKKYARETSLREIASGKERVVHRQVFDVERIAPGPVALSEFDVAKFRVATRIPRLLSVISIHGVILGVVLVILGLRVSRKSPRAGRV
ncbi:MAG: hypothetical protein NUV77_19325 [Thermoguttaceae bacterium]|jgi:hypothetical protein|nr:hypothetical protein [Thermoguttaceae bacterium]